MTTQPTQATNQTDTKDKLSIGRTDLFGIIGGILVVIISASVFFFTSAYYKNNAKQHARDTWVDMAGYLHVLGITLDRTTLRDAEKILLSRSDIALYHYPSAPNDQSLTLEASFPSLTDHSKVMLKLRASQQQLETFRSHATMPRIYPNKVIRMNLAAEDLLLTDKLIVETVTFIPSTQMDPKTLIARFGTPGRVETADSGTHYFYPAIGLEATIHNDDKKVTLKFTPPTDYPPQPNPAVKITNQ